MKENILQDKNMNTKCFLIFNTFLLLSQFTHASSFEEYIQRLSKHPQVESILSKSESINMESLGELGLPDPTLMVGAKNMPISEPGFDRFLPTSKVIGFSQNIPNSITRNAKSEKLQQVSKKQKLIAEYTKERLYFILITKMAEYKSLKTQKNLTEQQLEHYKTLEKIYKSQIESGKPVYKRFSEVDIERAKSELKLNNLETKIISIQAEFIRLINEVPEIKTPKILDQNWDQNPSSLYPVMIAAQDISITQKDVKIADADFLPNFGLDASYKKSDDNKGGLTVQAKVSIPLWASQNQEPKLKAAEARESSARFAYNDARRLWTQELISLQSIRDATAKNIKVLKEQDKAIKSKIEATKRNYEAGTEDLDSVILAKIVRLNIQIQLTQAKSAYISKAAEVNSYIAKKFQEAQK